MADIKNVIWDLSEVLLTGIRGTGFKLAERHGIDPAATLAATGFRNPLMLPAAWDFFHGKISEDEYIAAVLEAFPMFGAPDWLKAFIRQNFREIEGTRGLLNRVRELGYRTALLSVHGREWIDYCDAVHDFHFLFHVAAYSYEEGISKPEPEAFLGILKRLEAKPEECLFIDDSKKNIEAAQKLGIKAIQFVNAEMLESQLLYALPKFH